MVKELFVLIGPRFKEGLPLNAYDRSRFYGPFPDREVGYTDYPNYDEIQKKEKELVEKTAEV